MRLINQGKIAKAKILLRERKSFNEIRSEIEKEFGSGISHSTLTELNAEIKKEPLISISSEIKDAIKTMLSLFEKATSIAAFTDLLGENEYQADEKLRSVL